ncbi:MAG: CsfB protein [Tissierellia bacterium]|nr:CsfB protein [Tissierellia bacterium]
MYCKICGKDKAVLNILGQQICKECIEEIVETSPWDETYDYYKNMIRIILGYYISEKHLLNPVN